MLWHTEQVTFEFILISKAYRKAWSHQSKLREQRGLYDIFALEKHKYKQVRQTAANLFEKKKSRKEIKKKYTFLKIYA